MLTELRYWLVMVALVLVAPGGAMAQSVGDPDDPGAVTLKPWGTMHGSIDRCPNANVTEDYAERIFPLGDLNRDGLADFCLKRKACDRRYDHFGNARYPRELLIYYGVRGKVPDAASGVRISPAEDGSAVEYLTSGDWDGDGQRDLAVSLTLFGDTSASNSVDGRDIHRLVILWGQPEGQFSFSDTTQLSCGAEVWITLASAVNIDIDDDGIQDLAVTTAFGFSSGRIVAVPALCVYRGHHGKRWGREGIGNSFAWSWWMSGIDRFFQLRPIDQDCDGNIDIVGPYEVAGGGATGTVSVLYGRLGNFPDTLEAESVSLARANGKYIQYCDVTGDGVPELCMTSGSEDKIKIYAGKPGQRLLEQYGTGIDPPDPDNGRPYARPWAEIWQPHKIDDGWFSGGFLPLFAPGDLNNDGYCELCAMAPPLLVCYSTGKFVDSLFDAAMLAPDYTNMVVLGDIDGSGTSSIAVRGVNEVVFLKGDVTIPATGRDIRELPHAEGFRCEHATSVEEDHPVTGDDAEIHVEVFPNPTADEVDLHWTMDGSEGTSLIVTDNIGREVQRMMLPPGVSAHRWSTRGWSRGVYWLRVQQGSRIGARRIVIH
jgi:hypothetical protein